MANRSFLRSGFSVTCSRALLVAGCLATTLVVGCADPELEKQAAFEKQLNEVAMAYAGTLGSRPDLLSAQPTDESITALRSLSDKARSLSGGTAAQQEAAKSLAASVSRTVGSLELARAAWIESGHQIVRDMALSAANLAADMDAIAQASSTISLDDARGGATAMRDGVESAIRAGRESAGAAEAAASQLNKRVGEGTARLSQLEQEAAVLLRKARDSSAAAGLAFVEEAAAIKSEARTLQTAVSTDAIEADTLNSMASFTAQAQRSAQSIGEAAGRALELLGEFEGDVKSQAAKTRELATELRRNAESLMKSIADERGGALKSAYENAASDFEKASGGASGSSKDARALENLLTSESLRLHTTRLSGIGAQARMLAMAGAGGGSEFGELKTEAEALITALREKATAAADALASEAEDSPLADFKKHVDGLKKAADEMTVDRLLAPPAPVEEKKPAVARGAGSSGRSMSGSGTGVQDLEAFIEKLKSLSNDPGAASKFYADAIDDSSPSAKAMKSLVVSLGEAVEPMTEAMIEKFGSADLSSLGGGGGAGMGGMSVDPSSFANLSEVSNDGERAVYSAGEQEIVFVKTPSGWKIDLLEALRARGMDSDQIDQMAPMLGTMMAPMISSMKRAASEIAAKIRSGEITTAEEASAALQQAMMQGMGGGLGGGMRGRPGAGGGQN